MIFLKAASIKMIFSLPSGVSLFFLSGLQFVNMMRLPYSSLMPLFINGFSVIDKPVVKFLFF
jgi:hypothetical protein